MTDDKIILSDSPEAAHYVENIKGWVSNKGHFYGDNEDLARYDGATHLVCSHCKGTYPKNSWCGSCHDKHALEKFEEMPSKVWDGTAMLVCDGDRYFTDIEDAELYAEDSGTTLESLHLIICEPVYLSEIDYNSIYENDLPEDMSLGEMGGFEEVVKKFEELNEVIRNTRGKGCPISWMPGKFRLQIEKELLKHD